MKRKYEGLIVLNVRGREESVEKMVTNVGNVMESVGAKLEQIDHLGKKKFPYPKDLDEGYYVNYLFEADPETVDDLRDKLELVSEVHLQHFQRRTAS